MTNDISRDDIVSRENEQFIEQEIVEGRFRDRTEVIDAGIGLLRQQKVLVDRLANSRQQLDNGECVELDAQGLRQLFNEPKGRSRKQTPGSHGE